MLVGWFGRQRHDLDHRITVGRHCAANVTVDDLELHAGNWTQERQRVLTDANREATLLRAASAGAPVAVRGSLDRLVMWVDGVIGAVTTASSYDAARTAVAALDRSGVAAASSTVKAWHDANC